MQFCTDGNIDTCASNVPAAPAADKVVQMICAQVEKAAMVESTPVGGQLTVVVDGKPVVGVVTKK